MVVNASSWWQNLVNRQVGYIRPKLKAPHKQKDLLSAGENSFLSHADRGRAQDDVGLMGETDLRSSVQKGTVN